VNSPAAPGAGSLVDDADRSALLGIDIGGTFTDVVVARHGRRLVSGKYLSTPDPIDAVLEGARDVLSRAGVDPGRVGRVAHATTLATNLILERRGVRVAFVTTKGFRSMLSLGRSARVEEQRYDLFFDSPEPPVPPSRCFEVPERVLAGGRILQPLEEDAALEVAEAVARLDVEAVAVCFLHSYANPGNEQRMVALLRDQLPRATIVASSATWPELREYERAATTLMSAYVGPVMEGYLAELSGRLGGIGVVAPVHIMESSGGVMPVAMAASRPVSTIESGPAAGVMAVQQIGAGLGRGDLISFDMGGTTAKAGVIRNGQPDVTHQFHVGGTGSFGGRREGTGVPIKVPALDLAEVGAGGGSLAWVDGAGALRVGPQSAGAVPGPACYGRGGDHPTVTDADVVLGFLDARRFAGGTVPLYADLAESALRRHVADPLGIAVADAAFAIYEIANASMGSAVHVVTVQRGIDPRRFTIVALGGAGPTHAVSIAERFGIDQVVVPGSAGVGSAIGLLGADLSTERSRTWLMAAEVADFARIDAILAELARAGLEDLGADRARVEVRPAVDMRYVGQAHELTVDAPADRPVDPGWLDELETRFRDRYRSVYGSAHEGPVELVSFRARVVLPVARAAPGGDSELPRRSDPRVGERPAWSAACAGFVTTSVYDRSLLRPGDSVSGPAILEEPDATVLVPDGWDATVVEGSSLVLQRTPAEAADAGDG
jgi:N-methylhydantoinase A